MKEYILLVLHHLSKGEWKTFSTFTLSVSLQDLCEMTPFRSLVLRSFVKGMFV